MGAPSLPACLLPPPLHPSHACLQWLVGAFLLSSGWRLAQALAAGGGGLRLQDAGFAGLAAWALWTGAEGPLALAIMAGQLLAAVVS